MRFGFCIGEDADKIEVAARAGADYVESSFALLTGDEERFNRFAAKVKEVGLPCESVNCFIPGTLKSTGPAFDIDGIRAYVEKGMKRGVELGVKVVVYGSGGSRQIPEGWPFDEAVRQMVRVLKEAVAPMAEKYGITVVMEPLCDCNILNTVKEGVMLAAMANSPRVKGLGDLFHMAKVGDAPKNVLDVGPMLAHAHIANPEGRVYPKDPAEYDYKSFIDALEAVGCERCSVEANCKDFAAEAPLAIKALRG